MASLQIFAFLLCLSTIQAAPPEISGDTPDDYTGFADYFQTLECNINGGKTYEWYHNDTLVTQSSAMFYKYGKRIFVKAPVATNNYQGTYYCKASNDDGTLVGPKINVYFSIVGKFFKTDQTVEEAEATVGRELTLACPPRTLSRNVFYHWGGRQGVTGVWFLPNAKHYMITEDGALLFANVKDDDLEYFNVQKNGVSCSIESKGKTKRLAFSQKFLLREVGDKNVIPFGPTITTELKDKEVAKGEPFVIFRCGAIGLPTPDYSWTFRGKADGPEKTIISGQDGYELQDYNHVLMITNVATTHDGWYKCKVRSNYNDQVHEDEKEARLYVKGKPRWDDVNGGLVAGTYYEGTRLVWLCHANGNPTPTYTWFKDGQRIIDSDTHKVNGGALTFEPLSKEDGGLYQCTAENEFGSISSSAVLTVESAPTTQPSENCASEKRNLMFLVDGSGSVPPATFQEFKKFMVRLVKKFDIGPNTTHVGLLQYSSKPHTGLEFHFREHQTELAVVNAINEVEYHYGAYTFGGYAMDLAQQIMNHYDRADAKNVWVLLMDDGLWDKTLARKISKAIRQAGTKVIVLDTSNIMHDIADQGLDFTTDNLNENVETVKEEICK